MDKLIEAAQAFVDKLALVEAAIDNAFGFQVIHGGHYDGPNYGKELAALKSAIAAVRAHDAQLDAETPAEPVKDVVGRMLDAWYTYAESRPYDDLQLSCMTAALAVAREGYVKLEDVEKAIRDCEQSFRVFSIDGAIQDVRARLAPKPSLAEEIERILAQTDAFHGQIGESQITSVAAELAALIERRTK